MKYFPIPVVLMSVVFGVAAVNGRGGAEFSLQAGVGLEASQDEFDDLLLEAARLYNERKWEELVPLAEKLVKLRPDDNRGWAISAYAHLALWKLQEASDLFAMAIKLSPGNPVLRYHKARADRFRNAKEEGLESVRKAIELKPDYAEAYLLMGDLLGIGASKENSEQIAALRKAIELKPDLLEAYRQLGMVLQVSGEKKGAEEAYRKALAIDPKNAPNFFDLGRLLVDEGRLKEARELWEKRPPNAKDSSFPNFITVLERAEKLEAARLAYEKNPKDPEVTLQMGTATMDGDHWVVDGRQEKAIEFFRKALEIKPDFVKAQYAICKAYVQIADTYKSKNKELDEELAKLRGMDAKLADEIVEYRNTYKGGLQALPPPPSPKKP